MINMRDKVLELLLGVFPLLGIMLPTFLGFKRKLDSEKYQSGGLGLHEVLMASLYGFVWFVVALLFVVLIIKLLEVKGIPATEYIRRFWS